MFQAKCLVLGSKSPRRKALLEGLGLEVKVVEAHVDESVAFEESPTMYLERVVEEKFRAVSGMVVERADYAGVLVADTVVLIDGDILGKPIDFDDAHRMVRRLSNRVHEVRTRFAIGHVGGARVVHAETVSTRVHFRELSEAEIAAYVASGEGLDKAGAYAIQGVGAFAVRAIEGSYPNVVGLPICEVAVALAQHGMIAIDQGAR